MAVWLLCSMENVRRIRQLQKKVWANEILGDLRLWWISWHWSILSQVLALWGEGQSHMCHTLQWRHNGRDSISNHQPHDCVLNRLFRRRSKKASKLCVTGLCAGNSPGTGEFPAQMASDAENVSIWWRHHDAKLCNFGTAIGSRCKDQ